MNFTFNLENRIGNNRHSKTYLVEWYLPEKKTNSEFWIFVRRTNWVNFLSYCNACLRDGCCCARHVLLYEFDFATQGKLNWSPNQHQSFFSILPSEARWKHFLFSHFPLACVDIWVRPLLGSAYFLQMGSL